MKSAQAFLSQHEDVTAELTTLQQSADVTTNELTALRDENSDLKQERSVLEQMIEEQNKQKRKQVQTYEGRIKTLELEIEASKKPAHVDLEEEAEDEIRQKVLLLQEQAVKIEEISENLKDEARQKSDEMAKAINLSKQVGLLEDQLFELREKSFELETLVGKLESKVNIHCP